MVSALRTPHFRHKLSMPSKGILSRFQWRLLFHCPVGVSFTNKVCGTIILIYILEFKKQLRTLVLGRCLGKCLI